MASGHRHKWPHEMTELLGGAAACCTPLLQQARSRSGAEDLQPSSCFEACGPAHVRTRRRPAGSSGSGMRRSRHTMRRRRSRLQRHREAASSSAPSTSAGWCWPSGASASTARGARSGDPLDRHPWRAAAAAVPVATSALPPQSLTAKHCSGGSAALRGLLLPGLTTAGAVAAAGFHSCCSGLRCFATSRGGKQPCSPSRLPTVLECVTSSSTLLVMC